MNNFAKIVLVILGIITCFWIKDTFFKDTHFGGILDKLQIGEKFSKMKPTVFDEQPELSEEGKKIIGDEAEKKKIENTGKIYFWKLDKEGKAAAYISKREFAELDLNVVVKNLLKGPNAKEELDGVYTEIPKGTKLLSIVESDEKIIINLNDNFQYGGGTESIDNRLKQLVKTVMSVSPQKDIYLYLDGKQADVIGGDGVMLTQPINGSEYGY